jgi:hypothetical protein
MIRDIRYTIGQSGQKKITWRGYLFNLRQNAENTAIQNFNELLRKDPLKAALYAANIVILKVDRGDRSDIFQVVKEYPITFEEW